MLMSRRRSESRTRIRMPKRTKQLLKRTQPQLPRQRLKMRRPTNKRLLLRRKSSRLLRMKQRLRLSRRRLLMPRRLIVLKQSLTQPKPLQRLRMPQETLLKLRGKQLPRLPLPKSKQKPPNSRVKQRLPLRISERLRRKGNSN